MEISNKVNIANLINHHEENREQILKTQDKQGDLEADELMEHCATQEGTEKYRCSVCGKYFNSKENRDKHYQLHKVENYFSCDVCGNDFTNKGSLKTHKKIHTDEKPFSCKVCGKEFVLKGNLESHLLTHTGEKPFKCTICKKRFSQLGNMRTHELTHTGEKPHICNICGKGFAQKGNLKSHTLIHTGNKPYMCETCGKSFAQKGNFETHQLKHISEVQVNLDEVDDNLSKSKKYFSCTTCGQKFRYECKLDEHKLTHTEVKSFICSICDKQFKTNSTLKTHTRIHKRHKLSFCNICGEEFENNDQLKIHIEKHNDENTKVTSILSKKCNMKSNKAEVPLIFTNIKKNMIDKNKTNDHDNTNIIKETDARSMCDQRLPDLSLICDFIEGVDGHPKTKVQNENTKSTFNEELFEHTGNDNQTYNDKLSFHDETKNIPKDNIQINYMHDDFPKEIPVHSKKVQESNNITGSHIKIQEAYNRKYEINNIVCDFQKEERHYPETAKMSNNTNGQTRDSFFNCSMCGMAFNYMSELDHHMTIHFSEESIIDTVLNW